MRRYYILHGDKTTVGGTVLAFQRGATNNGRSLAMIGDKVICPKCNTTGMIGPNGPRQSCRVDGREPALNWDLCLCACDPKPKLLNSREDMGQTMTVEGVIAQGFGSWVGYKQDASSADNEKLFDDKFILRDNASRPIANAAYAIERATGMFEYGETIVDPEIRTIV